MARRLVVVCAVLALAGSFAWTAIAGTCSGSGSGDWQSIFDGKSLRGWTITGNKAGWTVQNGVIANLANGGGYLATEKTYQNFQLSLEYKLDKGVNSGIFFRWTNLGDPVQTGIEMQLLDSYGVAKPSKHDNGAMYDCLAPRKVTCKPAGEWNTVLLTCKDSIITVDMNGERVLVANLDRWTEPRKNPDGSGNKFDLAYKEMTKAGHIGFQDHGGRIWFRNIKVRPL